MNKLSTQNFNFKDLADQLDNFRTDEDIGALYEAIRKVASKPDQIKYYLDVVSKATADPTWRAVYATLKDISKSYTAIKRAQPRGKQNAQQGMATRQMYGADFGPVSLSQLPLSSNVPRIPAFTNMYNPDNASGIAAMNTIKSKPGNRGQPAASRPSSSASNQSESSHHAGTPIQSAAQYFDGDF